MKNLLKSISVFVLVLLAASCKKEKDTTIYKNYFYTIDSSFEIPLKLYVNGVYKGTLPYIKGPVGAPLPVTDPVLTSTALILDLPAGQYDIQARKANDSVVVSGYIRFKKNESGSGGTMGGIGMGAGKSNNVVYVWK